MALERAQKAQQVNNTGNGNMTAEVCL